LPWEGIPSPKEIVRYAKRIGLDGIAITDHNNIKAWRQAEKEAKRLGVLFLPGEEIGSKDGHILAIGINEFVESGLSAEETVDRIRSQGGICIAPHPYDIKGDGLKNKMHVADAVEVFNALNMDRISNKLARLKARIMHKPVVAGSDAHTLSMIGHAVTIMDACSVDDVIKAIKKGNTRIEAEYVPLDIIIQWSRKRLEMSYGDVIKYINETYSMPKAKISFALLNRFLKSNSITIWKIFAEIGINISRIYALFNFIKYY